MKTILLSILILLGPCSGFADVICLKTGKVLAAKKMRFVEDEKGYVMHMDSEMDKLLNYHPHFDFSEVNFVIKDDSPPQGPVYAGDKFPIRIVGPQGWTMTKVESAVADGVSEIVFFSQKPVAGIDPANPTVTVELQNLSSLSDKTPKGLLTQSLKAGVDAGLFKDWAILSTAELTYSDVQGTRFEYTVNFQGTTTKHMIFIWTTFQDTAYILDAKALVKDYDGLFPAFERSLCSFSMPE